MISLRVEGLGKAYQLYKKPIDSLKELLLRRTCHETFWALREVNFELPTGAALGVVGDNGAGKTTLLQLLAGTINPTCGKVERHGRVSPILELGAGFHPELSGEENIRIGCAMLGVSPAETERRLPEIIEFSELEKFISRPVKTYSSGMYLRLGFSIATSVDPDILVVDEHLAVGDQHFHKKCMDRMMAFLKQGKTLIFCSHVHYFIKELCDRCLWLHEGRIEMLGSTMPVLDSYQDYVRQRDGEQAAQSLKRNEASVAGKKLGETYLREATLGGDCRDGVIETGRTLKIRIVARLAPAAQKEGVHAGIVIVRNDMAICYGVNTKMDELGGAVLYPLSRDEYGISFVVENLSLLAGEYHVNVFLSDLSGLHNYDVLNGAIQFKVQQRTKEVGLVRLAHRWEKP